MTITISYLERGKIWDITTHFDPNEPIWQFSKRITPLIDRGEILSGNTSTHSFSTEHKIVNTFNNRLRRVGEIVKHPEMGLYASINLRRLDPYFAGNCSPLGAEREICAICLDPMKLIASGRTDNPLIPIAISCGHAFHKGCIQNLEICPLCRAPIT
ncbi:MAG TPA: hypothetical protein VJK48_05990 [Chlamydiales bacterium]|nr:hypothetical protein [Chlamydiales bacterium]